MKHIFIFLSGLILAGAVFAQEPNCDFCPEWYDYDDLEVALKEPEKVTNLDIAMQKLTVIDPRIGELTNLECLDLSFNRISTLPAEFEKLVNLRCLKLTGTRYMAKIPEVLTKLPKLEYLDLRDHPEWKSGQLQKAKEMLPNVTIIGDQ